MHFDTREEKWEATNAIHDDVMERLRSSAIEFEAQGVPDFELSNYCSSASALCHHADNIQSHKNII